MMARRQRNIRTKYKDRIKIRTTNGRPEIRPFGLTSICAKLRTLCTMKLKRRLSESKVDSLKYARTNFIFPPRLPKSKPPKLGENPLRLSVSFAKPGPLVFWRARRCEYFLRKTKFSEPFQLNIKTS
jgi:hypothetical protein